MGATHVLHVLRGERDDHIDVTEVGVAELTAPMTVCVHADGRQRTARAHAHGLALEHQRPGGRDARRRHELDGDGAGHHGTRRIAGAQEEEVGLRHHGRGRRLLSAPMALTPDAALDLLRSPFALEDLSAGPFVVDTTQGTGALSAVSHTLRALPCVTVAVSPEGVSPDRVSPQRAPTGIAAFDVVITEAEVDDLTAAVTRSPMASLALVQLLRAGESLDVWGGLFAESAVYSMLQSGPEFTRWLASRPRGRADPPIGPAVITAREGALVHVTLNRPKRHNAFDTSMRDELVTTLRTVAADPSVAELHLDGTGPSFCSGGDLAGFGTFPDPASAHGVRMTRSPAWWLAQCADRTSVAVHGACIGAGIELAAFARELTATADAFFQLPEVALGLVPGAGGTVSLPRRIGRQRTAWLALSGHRIDAATALAWGLVDRVSGRPHRH
jgi:hypothetical protein